MLGYQLSTSNKVYSPDGWFGLDFSVEFDIGANWEVPMYSLNEDFFFRARPALYVGGEQWVMFQLWYWKFWFFFDVYPVKFYFFDWYLKFNMVEWNFDESFCTAAMWELDVTRF